jgi:hypothetical protein
VTDEAADAAVRGTFRRRIRLIRGERQVVAGIEDDFHAFKVVVTHDGQRVTDVAAEAVRYPLDTCPGAIEPLQALHGATLSADCRAIGGLADARMNCTHLFDLAGLAIAHACRDQVHRQYDVAIPDAHRNRTQASLFVDGSERLRLEMLADEIEAPAPFAGQNIGRGFSRWVLANVADMELREALLVLHRGWFVSRGRQHVEQIADLRGVWTAIGAGACYSHQPERKQTAVRLQNTIRDFTSADSALVQFLEGRSTPQQ